MSRLSSVAQLPVSVGCEAHKFHTPTPTYLEIHHVIPQAWQRAWWPTSGSFLPPAGTLWGSLPGDKREGVALWDPRTAALCRTGHGNVHWWLVKMMKWHEANKPAELQPLKTMLNSDKFVRKDAQIAYLAMERFVAAGGKLEDLIAKRLYGEI
jgi:hypothetical protein